MQNFDMDSLNKIVEQLFFNKIIMSLIFIFIIMILKDFISGIANNFIDSIFFKLNSDFKPGKHIKLNDIEHQIIKIGWIKSIFKTKENEWVTIFNSRLKYQKISQDFRKDKKEDK